MELLSSKFLKKGRWHVRVNVDGESKVVPRAHYKWLVTNPAFNGIPKGYVVHHLDRDEMNDDPSNLVIMGMQQHRAYHLKNISPKTNEKLNFEIDNDSIDRFMLKKCTLGTISENKRKKGSKYIVRFRRIFKHFNNLYDAERFLNSLRYESSMTSLV